MNKSQFLVQQVYFQVQGRSTHTHKRKVFRLLSQKIFISRISEMPIPAFSTGHFQYGIIKGYRKYLHKDTNIMGKLAAAIPIK